MNRMMNSSSTFIAIVFATLSLSSSAWTTTTSPSSNTCTLLRSKLTIPTSSIPSTYQQQRRHHRMNTVCSVQRLPFQDSVETSKRSRSTTSKQNGGQQDLQTYFPWMSSSEDKKIMQDSMQFIKDDAVDNNPSYVSNERSGGGVNPVVLGGAAVAAIAAVGLAVTGQFDAIATTDIIGAAKAALDDPSAALEQVVQQVDSMGPLGPLYFGAAYTFAEILAIPAIPLTASAGYLFGPALGTGVVLISASIAAAVSFAIGRTLLRDYVEGLLKEYPDFAKIDRAIGKEGFKLMLLLRLSPIFPFALSNYLYGATSINFPAFFWGTLLGFAPGTLAYVYTGYVGKALTTDGSESLPWFVYAGGLALLAGLMKVLADVAARAVEELEDE